MPATSIDDDTHAALAKFERQMHARRAARQQNGAGGSGGNGASTSRSSAAGPSSRTSRGNTTSRSTSNNRPSSSSNNRPSSTDSDTTSHLSPLDAAIASLNSEIGTTTTSSSSARTTHNWDAMPLRDLEEVRPPRRYFAQRIRRVVYGGNYWSAPMRTASQRARGMTEDSVTVKSIDRKLLPVSELIKRIEEAQSALAAAERERIQAPIRARNRMVRMQRRGGGDETSSSATSALDEDDDTPLDADHIDLLSLLDHKTLHDLKLDFSRHEKALSLQDFVEVMRRYLPSTHNIDEMKLASNLCKFFDAVDVNGDGTMEWNEFTGHISEVGLSSTQNGNGVSGGGGGGSGGSIPGGESSRYDIVEEYRKSSLTDDFTWSQPISQLYYFDALDHLISFQQNQSSFNVFKGKKLNHVTSVEGHTSELLSAEYISKYHWIVTSSNDRTMRFWDALDHYKPVRSMIVRNDHTQICMRYAATQQLLFTATDQKQIRAYRIDKTNSIQAANSYYTNMSNGGNGNGTGANSSTNPSSIHASHLPSSFITPSSSSTHSNANKLSHYATEVVSTFSGQSEVTLDLLVLDNMSSLASASLDTTIGLYDLTTHSRTSLLKSGHKKGVFKLAYHPEYHVLVSAGYEHSAVVWNPYCGLPICKLKGHYSPLIGVECVPNSPQIMTADSGGIIKIWDIRNFSCVQSIYVEDQHESRVEQLNAFVSVGTHKRIISGYNHLYIHDSLTSSSFQAPNITDLEPTIKVCYNTLHGSFISASGQTIKVWNGSSGVLERVYRNVISEEYDITSLCLDDSQKKYIIGDTSGTIRVYNWLNGSQMKMISNTISREITSLVYIPQLKNILVTSWDGSIVLYDESQEEGLMMIKKLKSGVNTLATATPAPSSSSSSLSRSSSHHPPRSHGSEIITTCYSEVLTLFASGSSSGLIQLWDYRSHILVGELLGHTSEITSLCFLDPYPLLVSADNEGNICFWVVRPLVVNIGKCILRMVNTVKGVATKGAAANGTKEKDKESKESGETSPPASTTTTTSTNNTDICPVTALAFWCNIDARTYIASINGDEGITPLPPLYACLYAGDVNGVIRCWDILPALQRWGLQPFYTHDRLIPTGRVWTDANGNGTNGGEVDPNALTAAEKNRMMKQIQANGLATGGGAINGTTSNGGVRKEDDLSDAYYTPSESPSSSITHNSSSRLSLPHLVSTLASKNTSSFTAHAELISRAYEIGTRFGASSVEYEAALSVIPGATAKHWMMRKEEQEKQRKAEEEKLTTTTTNAAANKKPTVAAFGKKEEIKPSSEEKHHISSSSSISTSSSKSLSSSSSQRSRHAASSSSMNEEKSNELNSASTKSLLTTAAAEAQSTAATTSTRILTDKLSALANATAPTISNHFTKGSIKLRKSERDEEGGVPKVVSKQQVKKPSNVNVSHGGGEEDDEFTHSSSSLLTSSHHSSSHGSAQTPSSLILPNIPLLPLSTLPTSSNFTPELVSSVFLPKLHLRHSRANDYVEYRRTHRDIMNSFEHHARDKTRWLQSGDVKLVHWWIAHTDAIRDMHIVREEVRYKDGQAIPHDSIRSEALLSCSFDKKVCLWERGGASLGHLQQGRTEEAMTAGLAAAAAASNTSAGNDMASNPNNKLRNGPLKPDWLFHSDVRGRYERSQTTARQVLHRLNTARVKAEQMAALTKRQRTPAALMSHAQSRLGTANSTTAGSRLRSRGADRDSLDQEFDEFLAQIDAAELREREEARLLRIAKEAELSSPPKQYSRGDTFMTDLDGDTVLDGELNEKADDNRTPSESTRSSATRRRQQLPIES